ncbi:hypothetical protein Q7C36_015982 [Tachysurus vachellii]|uniref:Forkhead box protein M1 n=1 Tax=Tachysurus vachellii TaxID=175792 RepID=A0AA88SHW8_TACVA|nr:hypothetical protein Q7C36_015982 [Tachysurus vachellii]
MMSSPRRPIILTRRKRPFQRSEADETQNKSYTASGARSVSASAQDGIRVVDHPTRPEALVVVVPETAGLQSVLDALTVKRKERGTPGPNKFIFLSGRCGSDDEVKALFQATSENKNRPEAGVAGNDQTLPNSGCTCKEKFDGCVQLQEPQHTEEDPSAVKGPLSERPPYSYMAMIQFAINSKKNKMMTLKEIYNWIEDHFPYFRNIAKPGWKNSIRHNLSLHDMFIRESTPDGKISYWTIKPEANRGLTLDQVYKPAVEPAASSFPQAMQVCYQQVPNESSVVVMSAPVAEVEEERVCIPFSEPCNSEQKEILRKRYERISRRKQRLVPLSNEEPVLLFDSSLVSTFQEMECDLKPLTKGAAQLPPHPASHRSRGRARRWMKGTSTA